ncbi:MAG: CHAT domain-containing protein [Pyrinomonadaceae bacterium]|nr:CHAT domain-containing protein [Sphingobacteriaceae bacterium]
MLFANWFLLLGLFLFQPSPELKKQQADYKQIFRKAENLSNAVNPTDHTDSLALKSYQTVIRILAETKENDVFLFKTYISTGAFCQVLNQQNQAIYYFRKSLDLKKRLPQLKDSVLFKPLVYSGNGYYMIDQPDMAESFYKKAEAIAEKYPNVSELERLYNTLGVLSYSTGNYSKSLIYYEKAISTLVRRSSFDTLFLVTYKNNLASSLKKLKRYDQALVLYRSLLPYGIETDKLLHNIGSVYLQMGKNVQAIEYLQKVRYQDQKKFNDLGLAYFKEKNYLRAGYFLQKAGDLNAKKNGTRPNSDYGLTLKYFGDISMEKQEAGKALSYYQKAIVNLLPSFKSNDLYKNPTDFSSAFNGIDLLETLVAKAVAFKLLYGQGRDIKNLEGSLQTYLSFYKLADHIERIYDTDESRLLINDRKYFSHQQPIDICLELYRITRNRKYKELAFFLDEENKANTLSLYREEAKLKVSSGIPPALLKEETSLKENITWISLKASVETDRTVLDQLRQRLEEQSIKLLKVQQKINQQPGYSRLKFSKKRISIAELQKIIPSKSAILSYHVGESNILCFVITDRKFELFTVPINKQFFSSIKELYGLSQFREGNKSKRIKSISRLLYSQLIKPAERYISGKDDLMLIPDDELNYIPFELLVSGEDEILMNHYAITYNYSCTLLNDPDKASSLTPMDNLAMAPFDQKSSGLGTTNEWNILPASAKEIQGLKGVALLNTNATKQRFLKDAPHFNMIHLATHAFANDQDPAKSYIAFYPQYPDSAISYRLYTPEIYNLNLDKTRLVVLSACESGKGELIKGEGLISLSRAFSYSGCPNIITSMWKADDGSTAYISARLHTYINKGYRIAEALQLAKLDYLDDQNIPSREKLPGYWAHLRLIGDFEKAPERNPYMVYIVGFTLLGMLGLLGIFLKKERTALKN